MDRLLHCPFCGGEATAESNEKGYSNAEFHQWYRCGCKACKIWFCGESRFLLIGSEVRFIEDGYKMVVDAWNRRADNGLD